MVLNVLSLIDYSIFMKIRTKLVLTYLTVSSLALIAISLPLYSYVKKTLSDDVLNHLASVSAI